MYNRGSKRSGKRTTTSRKHRQQMIEALEIRQLLTTLHGGGTGQLAEYTFASDGSTTPDTQIDIYGNVTAEFIFMHGGTQTIVNRDVTINQTGFVGGGGGGATGAFNFGLPVLTGTIGNNIFADNPTTATGSNIFAIYVTQSDINSYITVTSFGTAGITPFGGGVSMTNIDPANPKATSRTASAGSGGALLGAIGPTGPGATPIIKADINGAAFGVRPAGLDDLPDDPLNDLSAGLRVANGHDLGKFLFGGPVLGQVHVDGSMNLFYTGWLLTGDARGADEGEQTSGLPTELSGDALTANDIALGASQHIVPRRNFYIGGDLQNLVSDGPIGWDGTFGTADPDVAPFYLSGVDIYVRGRVGQILGNQGNTATVTVLNLDPATAGFVRPVVLQEELEGFNRIPSSGVVGDNTIGFPNTPGFDFTAGVLYQSTPARGLVPSTNDEFDTFQMLGTFSSTRGNDIVDLLGTLAPNSGPDSDPVDYYGVGLMAGQTIQVQLIGLGNSHVGIIDPDGRLIASDYSNLTTPLGGAGAKSSYTFNLPFQFTADRPGIYRVVVAEGGDTTFVGTPTNSSFEQYRLTITNLGAVSLGGVQVANQFTGGQLAHAGAARMLDIAAGQHQIEVQGGDFGGLYVSAQFNTAAIRSVSPTVNPPPGSFNFAQVFGSIYVTAGNLRVVDVSKMGVGTATTETSPTGMDINVPNGSVGLVQTRDAAGIMQLNPSIRDNDFGASTAAIPTSPTTPVPFTPLYFAIGGNYQVINAASRFTGGVIARGGMGILRAAAINGLDTTYINLDADNSGFDGKSDLIDIAGSIDGPVLVHGPGGNFRYMRVGGVVNSDAFFGTSDFLHVVHNYGESVSFTDDSGSTINITPVGQRIANPAYNPQDPTQGPLFFLPQLSTLVYPVRSGGVIVMDVQSTGSVAVNSVGGAFNSTAEISRIEIHGSGAAPVRTTRFTGGRFVTTLKPAFTNNALGNDLSVVITGSAVTDVAYIAALTPEPTNNFFNNTNPPTFVSSVTAFGNATLISNSTGGEILTVQAASLGTIRSTGTIGLAKSSITGNALNFIDPLTLGTAFAARTEMPVTATGTVVGDAFPFNGQTFGIAIAGDIAEVIANRGVGNIVSNAFIGTITANADGKNVANEHEGIEAPIWAIGATILTNTSFTGVQPGSIGDVHIGEGIVSAGSGDFARAGIFAGNSIGSITGSGDIRGDIEFGQSLGQLVLNGGSLIDANILNTIDTAASDIREIGTISTVIFASNGGTTPNVGTIAINGAGQGIIGTVIGAENIGTISVPNGFGIFSSEIVSNFATSGTSSITIGGYGLRDSFISAGSNLASIKLTGNGKNLSTNTVTSSVRQSEFIRANPQLGFGFDPSSGRALTGLNDIHAALGTSQASPVIAGVTDTGVFENSRVNVQGNLGSVTAQTFRGDPGLNRISAGNSIGTLQSRGLINGLGVVGGSIKSFQPGSDVLNLHMTISGPIDNITIKGTLGNGSTIDALGRNGRIGTVSIKKNLNGKIHAVQSIGTVTIGGSLIGSLQVDGTASTKLALKKLQVGGTIANGALDIGATGAIVNVGTIIIGKNLGGSAADSLHITGTLDRLQVGGTINASIVVGRGIGTLQAQRINGPVRTASIQSLIIKKGGLHGNLTVGGKLQTATIAGGVFGNISANNGIGTIAVSGNVGPDASIQSGHGTLDTLRVTHGDLDGDVVIAGKIRQIIVGGNVGDGTDGMTISGKSLGLLQIGGSVRTGVSITIRGPIDALIVGRNVDEGAVIQASALNRQKIGGQVFGTLLIG